MNCRDAPFNQVNRFMFTAYIRLFDIRTHDVQSSSSTPFALKYDFYRRKMAVIYNASELLLPSDEFTMPVRCPNQPFHSATAGSPSHYRTDSRAS